MAISKEEIIHIANLAELNLSEKDTLKVDSLDTGTFMHDTIDTFFNRIREKNIRIKDLSEDEMSAIIDDIINEISSPFSCLSVEKSLLLYAAKNGL